MPASSITIGVILGPHGIRGEVRLRSFAADPGAIALYGPFSAEGHGTLELLKLRAARDDFIAGFRGVADRDRAEALKGVALGIPRARLPPPADGQSYIADLIGSAVETAADAVLGTIVDVVNYGAGDLLDVRIEGRKDTVLIPYAKAYVKAERDGVITVDLPEGFLETE